MIHVRESPASYEPLIQKCRRLFEEGKPLCAWQAAGEGGLSPETLESAEELIFACRLISRLGDEERSDRLVRRAWRMEPSAQEPRLYRAYRITSVCGPVSGLRFVMPLLENPAGGRTADLMALAARCYSLLGDQQEAAKWIKEARLADPENPWILTEHAVIEETHDRRESAMALAARALELRPLYRPAVTRMAVLLSHADRDAESVLLLRQSVAETEWAEPAAMLANHHSESEEPEAALSSLDEYERRVPLRTAGLKRWIAGRRATLLMHLGLLAEAAAAAEEAGDGFHKKLAAKLRLPEAVSGKRVKLPVGFVRQHELTCAPATLTALASHWGVQARHLEVAGKICYDGTPAHSERQWAADSGLCGREFRVTPEVAVALLDRGLPFTLVTTWTTGAHLQAVIGYDSRAGLLLIRDPTHRHHTEAHLSGFLADYEAHGPRGMLVLPDPELGRLEGLELPEADLYDRAHAVDRALERHDREAARRMYAELCEAAPGHRLTFEALRSLAAYDQDTVKAVEALEGLGKLFPDNAALAWRWYQCAEEGLSRQARLEFLKDRNGKHPGESVFRLERARILGGDRRTAETASHLLMRHLRRAPADAQALSLLADSLWRQEKCGEALTLYRWSACLRRRDEDAARTYFDASLRLNRTAEALEFLRWRVDTVGSQSPGPAISLADCLLRLRRYQEADGVMEESLRRSPEDARLLAHLSGMAAERGETERAQALLDAAERGIPRQGWLRRSAGLAEQRMDSESALGFWKQALADAPLAMDAHRAVTRLSADREGLDAALAGLDECCARHPAHSGLARLRVNWLRDHRHPDAEKRLLEMLEIEPSDAWTWRELALERDALCNFSGASEAIVRAAEIAPGEAVTWTISGMLHLALTDRKSARTCYRRALSLEVGVSGGMSGLLHSAESAGERENLLMEILHELEKQVLHGGEIGDFVLLARPWLSPERLLKILRSAHAARPDLWQTWTTLCAELSARGEHNEALATATALTGQHPWLPAAWLHLSRVHAARQDPPAQLAALERALAINPGWQDALRERIDALDLTGRREEALATAREGVRSAPLEGAGHGYLADLLLRTGEKEQGLRALETAVRLSPRYDWAWERLARETSEGPGDRLLAAAEAEAARRPGEAASWTLVSWAKMDRGLNAGALEAVDRGLELSPRNVKLHDRRALLLCLLGREAEGAEACDPPVFDGNPPRSLKGRKAWILRRTEKEDEAAALLDQLVATEKDYFWPVELLHSIHFDAGRHAPALAAAEVMRSRWPGVVTGHRLAAEVLILTERHAEAAAAALTALRLDPYDDRAAKLAFDAQILDGDSAGAARTLEIMQRLHPGAETLTAAVRLHQKLQENPTLSPVSPPFPAVSSSDPPEPGSLASLLMDDSQEAQAAFQNLLKLKEFHRPVAAALDLLPGAPWRNPEALEKWVNRHTASQCARLIRQIRSSTSRSECIRDHLIQFLLYRMGERKSGLRARFIIRWNRRFFRSTTLLWGAAGYMLYTYSGKKAGSQWHSDWRKRPDILPHMLHNAANSTAEWKGLFAAEPARLVLSEMPGTGAFGHEARAGVALCRAMRQEREAAQSALNGIPEQGLNHKTAFLVALTNAALAAGGRTSPKAWVDRAVEAYPDFRSNAMMGTACREVRRQLKKHHLDPAYVPKVDHPSQDRLAYVIVAALVVAFVRLQVEGIHPTPPPPPKYPRPPAKTLIPRRAFPEILEDFTPGNLWDGLPPPAPPAKSPKRPKAIQPPAWGFD